MRRNAERIEERIEIEREVQPSVWVYPNGQALSRSAQSGLGLIEVIIVGAVIAILATQAVPLYFRAIDTSKNTKAVNDLRNIAQAVELHHTTYGYYPSTLAEIGMDLRDPWGQPYEYLRLDETGVPLAGAGAPDPLMPVGNGNGNGGGNRGGNGQGNGNANPVTGGDGEAPPGQGNGNGNGGNRQRVRKNRNLHPINTDFDLYSMGPDRDSVAPLTAAKSRDDLVRASNGRFFGVAAEFIP